MSEIEKFLEILFSAPSSPISASKAMEVRDWWDKAKIQYADRINACGADGWISVEDRPFSANQTAIVYIPLEKDYYMNIASSNDEGDLYDLDGGYVGYHASQITLWMPLPQPPKVTK